MSAGSVDAVGLFARYECDQGVKQAGELWIHFTLKSVLNLTNCLLQLFRLSRHALARVYI